ncbi:GSCOCG00011826001-RA-CDS, partial [Cotesia congregata]
MKIVLEDLSLRKLLSPNNIFILGLLCKIVGFLHNTYGKRLNSDGAENNIIVQYMRSKMGVENILSQEVLSQRWNRRKSMLKPLTAFELLDFLRLSEDQLKIFFTGSYQFSQALSYLAELLDEQNNLSIQYVKSAPNIIKAKVKSKHKNSKVYRIYIDYISNGTDYNSIQRYCCDCPNGNRKVGCCSYVAAIIYYLSYGR